MSDVGGSKVTPLVGGAVNGFSPMNQDKTGNGLQAFTSPSWSPFTVPGMMIPNFPRVVSDHWTYPFIADPSAPGILMDYGFGGSMNKIMAGYVADNPGPTVGGASPTIAPRYSAGGAIDPYNQPLSDSVDYSQPQKTTKGATPVQTSNPYKPYIPINNFNYQTAYGVGPDEKNTKWEEKNGIPSADSAFGSTPSLGMIQGLLGQIMSLASSFGGLSKQQKDRIKANTTPAVYSMIETNMLNSTDIQTKGLSNRVDEQTFADNMVKLLSNVQTNQDLQDVMWELRSNTALHGKDKIPTVEYRVTTGFGETGLIIDGYGNYKQNAYDNFAQFITQGVDNVEIISKFEGKITGKVLNVNRMYFGQLLKGLTYFIEGPNVTDNTHIVSFGTGANGNTGIYNLNLSSNTAANTELILYKLIPNPAIDANTPAQQGGGGGGGGLGGLAGFMSGINMFGDSSQLFGEIIKCHDPQASSQLQTVMNKIKQEQISKILSHNAVGERLHAWAGVI